MKKYAYLLRLIFMLNMVTGTDLFAQEEQNMQAESEETLSETSLQEEKQESTSTQKNTGEELKLKLPSRRPLSSGGSLTDLKLSPPQQPLDEKELEEEELTEENKETIKTDNLEGNVDKLEQTMEEKEEKIEEEEESGDNWWKEESLQIIEFHGYFRTRYDLFHNLHLGRNDDRAFPHPAGDQVNACGEDNECIYKNPTIAGGNMRFRVAPTVNVSETVHIYSQIDLLDNLVIGSTPNYRYVSSMYPYWRPLEIFGDSQDSPAWYNSIANAITVRRIWGEVETPLPLSIAFGRMPSHWGMGLMDNAGNGIDDDLGTTIDRVMVMLKLFGILISAGMDFPDEGQVMQNSDGIIRQNYDMAQLDDVNQYFISILYKHDPEVIKEKLDEGRVVIQGGLYLKYRNQVLAWSTPDSGEPYLIKRDGWMVIPDVWFQLRYKHFYFELEAGFIGGKIGNISTSSYVDDAYDIRAFGGAARAHYSFLNEQLNVGVEFGYASGDQELEGLNTNPLDQIQGYEGDHTISLFRFNHDYNVDLILFEQILGEVAGAYYIKPWVQYDIFKPSPSSNRRLGARLDLIYSRASEPISTIGNNGNLGVELNISLYYRTESNFFAKFQYGVLFPLDAFKDLPGLENGNYDLANAQTIQGMLAIIY